MTSSGLHYLTQTPLGNIVLILFLDRVSPDWQVDGSGHWSGALSVYIASRSQHFGLICLFFSSILVFFHFLGLLLFVRRIWFQYSEDQYGKVILGLSVWNPLLYTNGIFVWFDFYWYIFGFSEFSVWLKFASISISLYSFTELALLLHRFSVCFQKNGSCEL